MAKIFLYDEFSPEDVAMMQALYSRSPESVEKHVEKVRKAGSGNFMEKFYVGYGHASIADCGSTTVFIEDVSILVDKAVQDSRLYSGQETSTRYIDMSKRRIVDPIESSASKDIHRRWMDFYISSQEKVKEELVKNYPMKDEDNDSSYSRAITARTFDILRGFLPAGITTQLSWHTNLRQAHDKLAILRHHPLEEARQVAQEIHRKLQEKYLHSFSHVFDENQEQYRSLVGQNFSYFLPQKRLAAFSCKSTLSISSLRSYKKLLSSRPPKTLLPMFLGDMGALSFSFLLDYGSFRDIQRHRSGICRMPLLTTQIGFHTWYLEQLPRKLRISAEKLLNLQERHIANLSCDDAVRQYYIPLGYQVACRMTFDLPGAVYVAELRSGNMVHPTLRVVAHKIGLELKKELPSLALYCDFGKDMWDVNRGDQTIQEKK